MPRYIDADVPYYRLEKMLKETDNEKLKAMCSYAIMMLEEETDERIVDAIPIKWIRQWLDELRGTYTDDIQEELTKKHLIISIEALLFKWRKENESSISD